jgi:hypothetical protein
VQGRHHLEIFSEQNGEDTTNPGPIDLPPRLHRSDALYAPPNADGSRKMCANCFMYAAPKSECEIHAPDVVITHDMVCGYHVKGNPQNAAPTRLGIQTLDPELTGLVQVPGGTGCNTCHFYYAHGSDSGVCQALYEDEPPHGHVVVQALGCCAAWKAMD